jgi:hypothetical protein
MRNTCPILIRKPEEKGHLGDQGIDGKILKLILKK